MTERKKTGFWRTGKPGLLFGFFAVLMLAGCGKKEDVVIIYTNDVHCAVSNDEESGVLGYEKVAGLKAELEAEGKAVLLVDNGDAIQGNPMGTLSKGGDIEAIMEVVGYDAAAPGNHEFDYGVDTFLELSQKSPFPYLSCNFVDLRTGEEVLERYRIVEIGGMKIGLVGITTPAAFISSDRSSFMDGSGEVIYGFCQDDDGTMLYEAVQRAVDDARADGADYVIAMAHLGIAEGRWSSKSVIENTTGIDAVLDGHSHSVIEGERVKNRDGKNVLLTSTGKKLANIGELTITKDGGMSSKLVNADIPSDEAVSGFIAELFKKYEKQLEVVIGHIDAPLVIEEPDTIGSSSPVRIVRNTETNLGDLIADAYRYVTGADVAVVNGGAIRANILSNDVTYGDIIAVQPYDNGMCMVKASGQKILDALEFASSVWPGESGGFLHVSGMTYEIDTTIPSSVTKDSENNFVSVDGPYRVGNVMIGGKPLDVDEEYTLASTSFVIKSGGDGNILFMDCELLLDDIMTDNQAVMAYFEEVVNKDGGKLYLDPYGDGRIIQRE